MPRPLSKAYSYTRFSTPEQRKGSSRRRQEERAQAFAAKHKLTIEDRFDDFGVSAFLGKNAVVGALSRFIGLVQSGEIEAGSYLLVESMDRLTRQNVTQAMALLLQLIGLGVKVAILDEDRIYEEGADDNQLSLLVALLSMTRAHEESKRKSDMLSAAWSQKRDRARLEGKVTTSRVPAWLTVKDGVVQEVAERSRVVREIFEMARDGYGAYSIARTMNERGEKPWGSRKRAVWRESYIKKMLASRTVLGEYQPNRILTENGKQRRVIAGDPLIGYYPAVVDIALYREANEAVKRRSTMGKGRKGPRYANIFTGLLRCSCGAGVRYIDKGTPPKGGAYLQCSVAASKGACGARTFRYKVVEEVLLHGIGRMDVDAILGKEGAKVRITKLRKEFAQLADRQEALETSHKNMLALVEVRGPGPEMVARLDEIETELRGLRIRRDELGTQQAALTAIDPKEWRRKLKELFAAIHDDGSSDVVIKRRALAAELTRVVDRIVISDTRTEGWELADDTEDAGGEWRTKFGVTKLSELNKLARERSFNARIVYLSGEIAEIDGIGGEWLRVKKSIKMKNLEFRSNDGLGGDV